LQVFNILYNMLVYYLNVRMKQILLQFYFNIFKYLAKIYLFRNPAYIIWVTWSIWKTSCRMIISDILKNNLEEKIVYTSEKNFNWELWMSLSILWISSYKPQLKSVIETILKSIKIAFLSKKLYDIIILEYWIDHPWEMQFLLWVSKPNIWIVTKIIEKSFQKVINIMKNKLRM
jgi:UDP-N-acetylmuramyl pentapeptide synthase